MNLHKHYHSSPILKLPHTSLNFKCIEIKNAPLVEFCYNFKNQQNIYPQYHLTNLGVVKGCNFYFWNVSQICTFYFIFFGLGI